MAQSIPDPVHHRAGSLLLLGLFLIVATASSNPLLAQQEAFKYMHGERSVDFLVDSETFAIVADPSLTAAEIQKKIREGSELQVKEVSATPVEGLFLASVSASSSPLSTSVIDQFGEVMPALEATPCLRFRGVLHIPRSEILVSLVDGLSGDQLEELAREHRLSWLREFPALRPLFLARTEGPPLSSFEASKRLLENPAVRAASPNFIIHSPPMAIPDDPFFSAQWHLQNTGQQGISGVDIGVVDSWGLGTGSPQVTIAIIDEGVDSQHPDLAGNLVAGHDSTDLPSPAGIAGNCAAEDGHGTACAGIAAGIGNNGIGISGVCWNASIMSVRVGYGSHWTQNDWIIDALTWAVDNGADILSNSWGGGAPSTAEEDTIQYALTTGRQGLGSIVLFATGNDNTDVSFPAAYPQTIAVGATSPCDERKSPTSCDGETNWGSNFGSSISVVAPGVLITTTDVSGSGGYTPEYYISNFNGTSSATPVVAGAIGLLLSANESLTAGETRQILEAACEDQVGPASVDTPGWDPEMGHGRIDVANMLALLGGPAPPQDLTCSENNGDLLLSWTNGEPYSSLRIDRDGQTIAVLGGTETAYLDLAPPVGGHHYSVVGFNASNPSLARSCSTFVVGSTTDLVWAPGLITGVVDGGLAIEESLLANGRLAVRTTNITTIPDLNAFDHVWVNLGVYPSNHVLGVNEGNLLADFLTDGIGGQMLFIEGGDTWFFDPPRAVHPHFGITALSDGPATGGLTSLVGTGVAPCDLTGIDFTYGGEDQSIDQLAPQGASFSVQSHPSEAHDLAIFRDSTIFRTLGSSYEFGGVSNATFTRDDLMLAWLSCFGSLVPSVSALQCTQTGSDSLLSWIPQESYDAIEIRRDSSLVATLPGGQVAYLDVGVSTGSHIYTVRGILNSMVSDPRSCALDIRPLSVASLECFPISGNGQLSWVNLGNYAMIRVERQGAVIAALSGASTTFDDINPGGGVHFYSVTPVDSGIAAIPSACTIAISPLPPHTLNCTVAGNAIALNWVNGEAYESLTLERDGILLETLAAGSSSHVDPAVDPGSHTYTLRGNLGGVSSASTSCQIVVVNPPVEGLACPADSSGHVQLSWTNSATYSSIEVHRDGALIATLPGSSTSHGDQPVVGPHEYSLMTQAGGLDSDVSLCLVTVPLSGVTALTCSASPTGAQISWENSASYEGIEISRGGALISLLPGNATSFTDSNAPGGDHTYILTPFVASTSASSQECQVTLPVPEVIALTCLATSEAAHLNWQAGGLYSQILIRRDGVDLLVLPFDATQHIDLNPGSGTHTYEVIASLGSLSANPSNCSVVVAPAPVEVLTCSPGTGSALLSWQLSGPADSIDIFRDSAHLTTLPGGTTTFNDLTASPGLHQWIVTVSVSGTESASSDCSAVVLLPAVEGISCPSTGAGILLQWTNPVTYDSLEVRREGILLATLPGSASAFTDAQTIAGSFQYSVLGLLDTGQGQQTAEATCAATVLPLPVTALQCDPAPSGIDLSWQNGADYQQILIHRNGLLLATLAPTSTSFFDPVLGGAHQWVVTGVISTVASEGSSCSAIAPPAPVSLLSCLEQPGGILLQWMNVGSYESIRIELNGNLLAILAPDASSYLDSPNLGTNQYSVLATASGLDSTASTCSITIDLPAVTDLLCTGTDQDVSLSWIPQATYETVTIFRDGLEVFLLPGSATGIVDPGVIPGIHQYEVMVTLAGFSASEICSVTVASPPQFIRADSNGDGTLDISDPVLHLQWQFVGSAVDCLEALDSDGDGTAGLADVIYSLSAVFGSGPLPSAPFPDCGTAPQGGQLGCESAVLCP